jgi:hypothetical protein
MDADNNGAVPISPPDFDLMVRTVMGEASGDSSDEAVAHVIKNRFLSGRFGNSIGSVVLAHGQFEPWSTRRSELLSYSPNSPAYQDAAQKVAGALTGASPDPTNGATYFYSPKAQAALGRRPPSWDDGTGQKIGSQLFFGGKAPSANVGMLSAAPETDFLGGAQNPQASVRVAVAGDAAAALAKGGSSILDEAPADILGSVAPTATASAPAPQLASNPGVLAGAIPIDPKNYIPTGTPVNVPGDVVDRTQPIPQQLATAGRNALSYGRQQVGGIPGAVAEDWRNATALNEAGNQQLAANNPLGALGAVGGMIGQVMSPVSGTVRQLVQQPVTEATGNPVAGEAAGIVANAASPNVIGGVLGAGGRALSRGVLGTMPADDAQLASLATQKYNIPLTAPQLSTSPGLKIASSTVNRLPFSGAESDVAAQQAAFNRAVANTIGESADRITPDVMNSARARIGGYYDTVAQNTNLNVDAKFLQDLHDTLNNAGQVLPKSETEPLIKQAQNILEKIDPNSKTISGETYQALTNTGAPLDRLIESENPNVSFFANGLKKTLDSALERSAPPDQQQLLKTADRQWSAMRTIQPLIAKAPTGDVSPALLAGRVNASTGNGMAFGYGGDLGELARIGQRFLKEPGSSNTAERLSTIAGVAAAGPAAFNALMHGSLGEAGAIAGTLASGRVIGSGLRSSRLANALINRSLPGYSPPPPNILPWVAAGALGGAVNNSNALMPSGGQ